MSAVIGQPPHRAAPILRERLQAAIGAIAAEMAASAERSGGGERRGLSPGDLSALRRGQGGPAFWKLAVRHLEPRSLLLAPGDTRREERERRWIAIFQGMATLDGLHRPRLRLGQALAARDANGRTRVAEPRVLRLLAAEGETLLTALRGVVQQLGAAGQPLDWTDVAELVLSDGAGEWARRVREDIGFDYYRTVDADSRSADGAEEKEEP